MSAVGFFSAFFAGIILMAVGLVCVKPLAYALGSTDTILPYTVSYLGIILFGAPAMPASLVLNNQMRFQGSTFCAMIGIVSGAVINVILDPVLIFKCNLGIAGATLAMVISQYISFVLLVFMIRRGGNIQIRFRNFKPSLHYYKEIARGYYACYPFLLQLSVLYLNHYMLAETEEERRLLLLEAVGWCDRILENCSDVGVCSDAVVLKAGLHLQLGKAAEAIETLEPFAYPSRLAGQNGNLLVQAYQLAGDTKKARNYAQVKQYLDLLNLIGDAMLALSQCAPFYALHGREEEALAALHRFEKCVDRLLRTEQIGLHGDEYFNQLDTWIDRLPLGNMAPRDKSFIWQSLRESLAHPGFDSLKEQDEFQRLVCRLTEVRRMPDIK